MPIENASFLHQLEPANPAATDPLADADNHLRLLKQVLRTTFPNLTGAVTATQAQLANPLLATVPAANQLPYFSGTGTATTTSLTAYGRTVIGLADAAALRSNMGLDDRYLTLSGGTLTGNLTINATLVFGANASVGMSGGNLTTVYDVGDTHTYQRANDRHLWVIGNAERLRLEANGNLRASGDITAFSDRRLKTDVETIGDALDLVCALRGVRYTRVDTGARSVGVIAQETREVVPEVVHEDEDGYLSVDYSKLVGVLVEAIKSMRADFDALKDVVDGLKREG